MFRTSTCSIKSSIKIESLVSIYTVLIVVVNLFQESNDRENIKYKYLKHARHKLHIIPYWLLTIDYSPFVLRFVVRNVGSTIEKL